MTNLSKIGYNNKFYNCLKLIKLSISLKVIIKNLYFPFSILKIIFLILNFAICYGSGIPCHVVTCTSAASTGGVERQNSVFMYEPNLVNNFFFL